MPKGRSIRPTADRVREAIFNIIAPHVPDARVLDLFAGTGALGLEALSRGASKAIFVDEQPQAVRLIHENVELCGAQERVEVIRAAVHLAIRRLVDRGDSFHLIFMDPPYGKGYVEKTVLQLDPLIYPETLVVAEHHLNDALSSFIGAWTIWRERQYGDTKVSILMRDISC